MSATWKSQAVRLIVATCVIIPSVAGEACAQFRIVCIDPGHGGGDPGNVGSTCSEKMMNLNVGLATFYRIKNDYRLKTGSVMTRDTDVAVGLTERVMIADNAFADVFVSIHHDQEGVRRTFAIISDTLYQATWWPTSQFLGDRVAALVCEAYSTPRALTCNPTCLDANCTSTSVRRLTVLYKNNRAATLHEGGGIDVPFAGELCTPSSGTAVDDEAKGIYFGIYFYFYGYTSVGTSFTGAGGPGVDTLRWEESDPDRFVVYGIYRSDACWGPDEYIASVVSQDPAYTSDNRHYTYVDSTVAFSRPYWYTLEVTGERVTASATPSGLPAASPPGVPGSLGGTGIDRGGGHGTVNLGWNASTGLVSGYYVYRSRYQGMVDCSSTREYLGLTASTSFQDTTAPTGVALFYRVRAYNTTAGSGVSNETGVTITPVVGVEEMVLTRPPSFGIVSANPSSGVARFRYAVPSSVRLEISVYDIHGRQLATLVDGLGDSGEHLVSWNGADTQGRRVASGLYFVRMVVNGMAYPSERVVVLR